MDQVAGIPDDIKSRTDTGTWKICFRTSCVRLKKKKSRMTRCFKKIYILTRACALHAINNARDACAPMRERERERERERVTIYS
jgi:hypothetical protein